MPGSFVEHINVTVSNPKLVAEVLCQIFTWHIRWSGDALDNGTTIHVGTDESYLALYSHPEMTINSELDYKTVANLNHIGIVVDDLDAIEEKVLAAGFKPFSHRDYEPGRRFYFLMHDDIEIEVISYS
ncbi:MAG: VOC family protein [Acidiferrobacterales bacterium]|nr:VOC family protein [Acidiferrobacterales bacterium]